MHKTTLEDLNKKEPKQRIKIKFKKNFNESLEDHENLAIDKNKFHKTLRRDCQKIIKHGLDKEE